MDGLKSRFLDGLEAELSEVPASTTSVVAKSSRRPKAFAYAAMVAAMSGSVVFATASPASAAACNQPEFYNYNHMKWCGIARQDFAYLSTTVYYSARTTCYNFDHYAWMCGYWTRYYAGRKSSCRSY